MTQPISVVIQRRYPSASAVTAPVSVVDVDALALYNNAISHHIIHR